MAFTPRTTRPEAGNKYYIRKASGGWSNAIKGKPVDKDCDVLSNCVGYAYGRFNEIGGYGYCKYLCPVNAENFMVYKGDLETGTTPKLGACMVWRKGTFAAADGAGHVEIVEKVISDTEVVTSGSNYGGAAFFTKTRSKGRDGRWGQGSTYAFVGFIYNPAVKDDPQPEAQETEPAAPVFKVGDIVEFKGYKHYSSSNATAGPDTRPSRAKITAIAAGAAHPYHCRAIAASGAYTAGVYGWVNASDVAAIEGGGAADKTLHVGDKVKLAADACIYGTGRRFSSWVYSATLYVREIKGGRVVISTQQAGAVTGAVSSKHLIKA